MTQKQSRIHPSGRAHQPQDR